MNARSRSRSLCTGILCLSLPLSSSLSYLSNYLSRGVCEESRAVQCSAVHCTALCTVHRNMCACCACNVLNTIQPSRIFVHMIFAIVRYVGIFWVTDTIIRHKSNTEMRPSTMLFIECPKWPFSRPQITEFQFQRLEIMFVKRNFFLPKKKTVSQMLAKAQPQVPIEMCTKCHAWPFIEPILSNQIKRNQFRSKSAFLSLLFPHLFK